VKLASQFSIFRQASEEELLAGGLGFFPEFPAGSTPPSLVLWSSII
jgi:hypothetical protein